MNNILKIAKEKRIKIPDLAEKIGVTRPHMYSLMNGTRELGREQIIKLAEILECSSEDILGIDTSKTRNQLARKNLKKLMNGRSYVEFTNDVNKKLGKTIKDGGILPLEIDRFLNSNYDIGEVALQWIAKAEGLATDYFYELHDEYSHLPEHVKKFIQDKNNVGILEKMLEMTEMFKKTFKVT